MTDPCSRCVAELGAELAETLCEHDTVVVEWGTWGDQPLVETVRRCQDPECRLCRRVE